MTTVELKNIGFSENQKRRSVNLKTLDFEMRPEPPNGSAGVPEIFGGGIYGAIRRAVVIGNGFPGAENQCLGLVRALGLSGRHSLYVSTLLFPFHNHLYEVYLYEINLLVALNFSFCVKFLTRIAQFIQSL